MRRPAAAFLLALAAASIGCAQPSAGRRLIVNEFSTSAEGWQIAGDTGPVTPIFKSSGGREGGYISNVDQAVGETWYFRAPANVLAALSAAEGGRLEYTLEQSSTDAGFTEDDVVIVGPSGRLSFRFDYAPGTGWTDFSVQLSASADWRWNWNARATEEQIRSVLSHASRLEIRGEYRTGDDVGSMARFVLTSRD